MSNGKWQMEKQRASTFSACDLPFRIIQDVFFSILPMTDHAPARGLAPGGVAPRSLRAQQALFTSGRQAPRSGTSPGLSRLQELKTMVEQP